MYLHLGMGTVVTHRDIIGIFDLDNASWAFKTREFLEQAEEDARAVWLTDDFPRSIVLVGSPYAEPMVYLSPLSTTVLAKRIENNSFE